MQRLISLDLLRALAILLVLFRHFPVLFHKAGFDTGFFAFMANLGWVGVDLFFVLSGFLVAGLLIDELQRTDKVLPLRFLVRRGFKIYPNFYFFLLVSFVIEAVVLSRWPTMFTVIAEVSFLQNYFGGFWGHTWSLAIEEHFYFSLAIFFMVANLKFCRSWWVHLIPIIAIGSLFIGLFLRVAELDPVLDTPYKYLLIRTHFRFDTLVCGAGLAYLHRYRRELFSFLLSKRLALMGCFIVFIIPACVCNFETSLFMPTYGFTCNTLAFASLLLLFLSLEPWFASIRNMGLQFVSAIGRHSYSIYLWHLLVISLLRYFLFVDLGLYSTYELILAFVFYLFVCLSVGVFFSKVVESPFLKLRERLAP